MKIQFCGAAGTVTGSCFLVTTGETKFLIDCGMFQGSKELKERNYYSFLFNPQDIQFVLLTHTHIDHSGLLPKLFKKGFSGPVYTTKSTKELCTIVLPDSGHIQEMEVERKNRKLSRSGGQLLEPIYTMKDAQDCMKYFKGYNYNEEIIISPEISVHFLDAGHILGSAIIEVLIKEGDKRSKLVFSGDLGNINQPLIEDPTDVSEADVLIMESTYGNRYHLETENKLEVLGRVVKNTYRKGGNLIIPSFAVERTQDLVYDLKKLKDSGQLPPMEIYIDSPMAVEATKVFINNPQCLDSEATNLINCNGNNTLLEGPGIHYVLSTEESIDLNKVKKNAIIISASGMADAGRIKHHLKHNLWRKESTVLFVGYQAEGTLGRRILEGEKKVKIHGEEIAVRADIEVIDGYSAHADQKGLLDWLRRFRKRPRKVFLVHGEEEALNALERVIEAELGLDVQIARYNAFYDLEHGVEETVEVPVILQSYKEIAGISEAFLVIKDRISQMAKHKGKDVRELQRILAQLHEIEREISKTD